MSADGRGGGAVGAHLLSLRVVEGKQEGGEWAGR